MILRRSASLNLFLSVGIVFLFLFLVSLPGFASSSSGSSSPIFSTNTPTQSVYRLVGNQHDQYNLDLVDELSTPSSPDPTLLITYTFPLSDTVTPTSTYTLTPTLTPTSNYTLTPTLTPTPVYYLLESPTPFPTQLQYLAVVYKDLFIPTDTPTPTYTPTPRPPRPETVFFCDNLSQPLNIPDNNSNGINDYINISDGRMLVNISLYLNVSHTWVSDLVVTLTNQSTGKKITVLDRPGIPNSQYGCSYDNIIAILDDAAAQPAEDKCAAYPAAISGIYLPIEALSSFSSRSVTGAWNLNISDRYPNDTGRLNHWCLKTSLSSSMPPPTSTPTPVSLPPSAYVNGMSGQNQQLNLDCESRSAVDWAKHFGFNIGEIDFLNQLPKSDDPEIGFVGNPNGSWGNIPPNDYGVHSLPVSLQLQEYGVTASSYRSLQWDDLRAEIANGNPVIVWIIGGSSYSLVNGIPHIYTAASTGDTTIVAPWEHTVILVGYTPTTVTVLNGSKFVEVPLNQFLDSWSVLQFMGVTARP